MGQNGPQNINYSINGHTFFGHNSAIFCPIGLETFLVTHKIIIYRLVMRNCDFDAFLKISYFWRENGRGRHSGAKVSGASRPNQKVGPMGGPFGPTINSKTYFQKFRA